MRKVSNPSEFHPASLKALDRDCVKSPSMTFWLAKSQKIVHAVFMKTTTRSTNSVQCWLRRSLLLFLSFVIGSLTVPPNLQAVSPPLAPDTALPGGNTADGQNALAGITTGIYNSAFGIFSLLSATTANFNTGVGAGTLLLNDADQNTAVGAGALLTNTGSHNTAVGAFGLFNNDNGASNSAVGSEALMSNTTGDRNTANGFQALVSNTTGAFNTASGVEALSFNTTGNFNTALGVAAGSNITTANNVTCIGGAGSDVSDTTWISNVYGVTTVSGTTLPVLVSDSGQLGTAPSSRRFKKEIKSMDKASESILALKPVTFHYKRDQSHTPQFGLIAEEVAEVNPDMVVRDENGEIYSVRYEAVNAMLLNEFIKEHKAFVSQQHTVAQQQATITRLEKQIEALTAGLQKVSAQLDLSRTAPQTALNNR
jgi:hypothetical protein